MPRTRVALDLEVERISILDEEGGIDSELEPDVPTELLRKLHRAMVLSRRFDNKMLSLQRQGRLGTFAPGRGQEASQLGAVAHLRNTDWLVPSYREVCALLWRGASPADLLLFNAGYNEGAAIPDDHNDLPNAVPVASQLLHAAGLGYGLRVQGDDSVVMTFFGDGATSEGDFHEALNFAAVFDSPTVFVCQNNQYAISVPRKRQTASRTLAQKGIAYGIPCLQVDGNDLLAVYVACGEAIQRARDEHRPTLIECETYRLAMHTTVDDPSKYRSEEEVARWEKRDPLPRLETYLRQRDVLDDEAVKTLEEDVDTEIDEAVTEMKRRLEELAERDAAEAIFEHVWAEEPAELRRQREPLEATR
jgi:pyruvate dehydrogenase E1 component alpha subunit